VVVEVRASEAIVPHGVAKTTWWVFDGQRWRSVKEHPDATLERQDSPPGVVWETRAELRLPVGAWLMRVRTRPRQQQFRDPMRYLRGESLRAHWHTQRSYFVVGPRGVLQPARREDAPDDDTLDLPQEE
jgi:hypothetical protein